MSDEALSVHMDLLDKALEQGEDYEAWLERKVTHLEQANAALKDSAQQLGNTIDSQQVWIEKYKQTNANLLEVLNQAYDNLSWHPDDSKEALIGYIKDVQEQITEAIRKAKEG